MPVTVPHILSAAGIAVVLATMAAGILLATGTAAIALKRAKRATRQAARAQDQAAEARAEAARLRDDLDADHDGTCRVHEAAQQCVAANAETLARVVRRIEKLEARAADRAWSIVD